MNSVRRPTGIGALAAVGLFGVLGPACSTDGDSGSAETTVAATTSSGEAATSVPATAPPTTPAPTLATAPSPTTLAATSSTSATRTTPEIVDVGLVLADDGLGLFTFGAGRDEVIDTLSGLIGEPDEDAGVPSFPVSDVCRETGDYCPITTARWAHLTVQFRAVDDGVFTFSGYEFGSELVARPNGSLGVRPFLPAPWERAVATADGLTVGTPTAAVARRVPELWAIACGQPELERIAVEDSDQPGDLGFVAREARGLYLFPPFDGALRRLGAMDRPDATICEGG